MTASLCHRGSSVAAVAGSEAGCMPCVEVRSMAFNPALPEVVEVLLVVHATAHAKYVRRDPARIDLHEVARPRPKVVRAGDQVLDLVLRAGLDAQRTEIESNPARMRVVG